MADTPKKSAKQLQLEAFKKEAAYMNEVSAAFKSQQKDPNVKIKIKMPTEEEFRQHLQNEASLGIPLARAVLEKRLYKFNKYVMDVEKGKDRLPMGQVHKELCAFIDANKKKNKLILIPRGHLKSTVITVGRCLQAICANPNVRILIANATYALACSFLSEIKRHLKFNENIKMYWGNLAIEPEKWSENQISLNRGTSVEGKKEPTVTAMGLESSLTSQHYDIIIADDLVNDKYINTSEQIQKTVDFYKECLNLLEPGGEFMLIGTRWDDRDLYGWIQDKENNVLPDFEVFLRRSHEGSLDTDDGFKALYPEKFDRKHLLNLYKKQGPYVFSCQYLNDPVPQENADFKLNWFHYYDIEDLKDRPLNKFLLVDPAISTERRADFTAMVSVGVDDQGNVYVLNIRREHFTPTQIIEAIFELHREYQYIAIGLEDVAYQKSLHYTLAEQQRERQEYLPIREIRPNNRTKDQRIRGLQPLYANGKLYHRKDVSNTDQLEMELLRFPNGKHDDVIDALSYMLDIAFKAKQKKPTQKRRQRGFLY